MVDICYLDIVQYSSVCQRPLNPEQQWKHQNPNALTHVSVVGLEINELLVFSTPSIVMSTGGEGVMVQEMSLCYYFFYIVHHTNLC